MACQWLANGNSDASDGIGDGDNGKSCLGERARERESVRASECMREFVSAYYKLIVKNLRTCVSSTILEKDMMYAL